MDTMENNIHRNTVYSLLFLIVVIFSYFLRLFINNDVYRKLLSIVSIFVFYPSIFLSLLFSLKSMKLGLKTEIRHKSVIIFLNSLIYIFLIFFVLKIIITLIKPVN